MEPVKRTDLN